MNTNSCFFIGHHDAGTDVLPLLEKAVEQHITEYGVTDYCVGHYGAFDRMAARTVINAKKRHPEVTLMLLLPYYSDHPVPTPEGFDGIYYPPNMESVPKRYAIVRANQHMISVSTHLIAYAWNYYGSSGKLVEFARKTEKKGLIHIDNLAKQLNSYMERPKV